MVQSCDKWFFERPLPRQALPRWNAVQKHLVEALAPLGADQQARDASRVLRLVETINTRSGEVVRVLWANASGGEIVRYDFEYLAECILPVDRDTARQHSDQARQRRPALKALKGGRTGNLRPFSGRQLAWDRLEDLRTLAALRGWTVQGIPHGYRSKYLHWTLNFLLLSGATHSSQLFYEARALVREVCPDFTKDVESVLSTLYRKAQAYEAGEKVEFEGKQYPPLYTPKNETLIDLFGIEDAEMRQLQTIVTQEESRHRDAKRDERRRRVAGAMERATYLTKVKEGSAENLKPWETLGISRATWYRKGKPTS